MSRSARQGLLAVLGILALGGAGYFFLSGQRGEAAIPRQITTFGVCLSCKKEAELKHSFAEVPPYRCPTCGTDAFYPLMFCNDCRTRFVPQPEKVDASGPPRPPAVPICPKCRQGNVSSYIPMMCEVAGDAPLPRWP